MNRTVNIESKAIVFVAAVDVVCQGAKILSVLKRVVDVVGNVVRSFSFNDNRNVAIVAVLLEFNAAPIAGFRSVFFDRSFRVVVGSVRRCGICIGNGIAPLIVTGSVGIVIQRRQDYRIHGVAHDLNRAADTVFNVVGSARRGKAGVIAKQFDNQAAGRRALQTQTAVGVMVADDNFVLKNVNDVNVVPNAFRRQNFSANNHAVVKVVVEFVLANHRAVVAGVFWIQIIVFCAVFLFNKQSCLTTVIFNGVCRQSVGVDRDNRRFVFSKIVVNDNRLSVADVNNSRIGNVAATDTVRSFRRRRVVCEVGICYTQIRLNDFNRLEVDEVTFNSALTAGVHQLDIVQRRGGRMSQINAAPVAALKIIVVFWIIFISVGVDLGVEAVVGNVKRTAVAVGVVVNGREDNFVALCRFRNQIGVVFQFNSGVAQLDQNVVVNAERTANAAFNRRIAARVNINFRAACGRRQNKVFLNDVGNVPIVKASGNVQLGNCGLAWGRCTNRQTVDRVAGCNSFNGDFASRLVDLLNVVSFNERIVMNGRTNAIVIGCEPVVELVLTVDVRFFEAVRVGRNRRGHGAGNRVRQNCRTRFVQINRRVNGLESVDIDFAAAVRNVSKSDVVDEDAFVFENLDFAINFGGFAFVVFVFFDVGQNDAAPIAALRSGRLSVGVGTDGFIPVGSQVNLFVGSAQKLNGSRRGLIQNVVDRTNRALRAGSNIGVSQLDYSALLYDNADALRNFQRRAVFQSRC